MALAARDSPDDAESEGQLAPSARERQRLLSAHCTIEGHQEARTFTRKNLRAFFDVLIQRLGPLPAREFRQWFDDYPSSAPKQGLYTNTEFRKFFDAVARPKWLTLQE